jgi:hypothetical protein
VSRDSRTPSWSCPGQAAAKVGDRFWLILALTMPIILLSPDIEEWFGYSIPTIPGIEYVPKVLPMAVGAIDIQTSMRSGHSAENSEVRATKENP